MAARKLHKLSTREKIFIKLSSIPKSKTKFSLFLTSAWRNGSFKKTLHLFYTNLPKSLNSKSCILIQVINHMPLLQKHTTSYVGKNPKSAQSIIFLGNKSKGSSRWIKVKSVCFSKQRRVGRSRISSTFKNTIRWRFMI